MKAKIDASIGDRTDCYLLGQAAADLRCHLHAAYHELSEGDLTMAKTYLYAAQNDGRALSALHPGRPTRLREIIRGVNQVTKEVMTAKVTKTKENVFKLRESALKLRESTKAYCGAAPTLSRRKK